MKRNFYDLTKENLQEMIKPSFRAKQLFSWVYQKYSLDFNEMTNLSKNDRAEFDKIFSLNLPELANKEASSDGSIKYLFKLIDGYTIETVLLPMKNEVVDESGEIVKHARYSVCISTQVGCKMGCAFCYTAKGGFKRDLTPGEIVTQVLYIKKELNLPPERRVNIVFMGMGEPLDNLENLATSIKIFGDVDGLSISPRRQTISTSGLATKIEKLAKLNLNVLLAISLHAVDDELRDKLMPVNKAYNIASIIEAIKKFPIDSRKRVMFEYLMIKDLNDDLKSAKKLIKLMHGIKAKINLIYFNPHEGSEFQRPLRENVEEFKEYLNRAGLICTIRESKGLDISAACGQLKERSLKNAT